jgi:Xaa-Pro dipeptidase
MPLHFSRDEFGARRRRACDEMAKAGLDGLLIFRQESMYYLSRRSRNQTG